MENKVSWSAVVIVLLIIALAVVLWPKKQDWLGFYYPDSNNLGSYTTSSHFDSKEECLTWAQNKTNGSLNADYECGLDCKFDAGLNGYQCKETTDQ